MLVFKILNCTHTHTHTHHTTHTHTHTHIHTRKKVRMARKSQGFVPLVRSWMSLPSKLHWSDSVAVTDSMQVNSSSRARWWKPPWSRQHLFLSHNGASPHFLHMYARILFASLECIAHILMVRSSALAAHICYFFDMGTLLFDFADPRLHAHRGGAQEGQPMEGASLSNCRFQCRRVRM